jgi:hypothetical protein
LLVISSRASYEMVSKAMRAGASVLAAVSAPTALAIDLARSAGLCLVGFARESGFNVYTHPERLQGGRRVAPTTPSAPFRPARAAHCHPGQTVPQRSATFGKSTGTSKATLT